MGREWFGTLSDFYLAFFLAVYSTAQAPASDRGTSLARAERTRTNGFLGSLLPFRPAKKWTALQF